MRPARAFSPLLFIGGLLMVALAGVHISTRMPFGKSVGTNVIVVAIYAFVAMMLMLLSFGIGWREKRVAQSQTAAMQSTLPRARSLKTRAIWAARLGVICLMANQFVQGVLRPAFPQYDCLSPVGGVALILTITGMVLLVFASVVYAMHLVESKRGRS